MMPHPCQIPGSTILECYSTWLTGEYQTTPADGYNFEHPKYMVFKNRPFTSGLGYVYPNDGMLQE